MKKSSPLVVVGVLLLLLGCQSTTPLTAPNDNVHLFSDLLDLQNIPIGGNLAAIERELARWNWVSIGESQAMPGIPDIIGCVETDESTPSSYSSKTPLPPLDLDDLFNRVEVPQDDSMMTLLRESDISSYLRRLELLRDTHLYRYREEFDRHIGTNTWQASFVRAVPLRHDGFGSYRLVFGKFPLHADSRKTICVADYWRGYIHDNYEGTIWIEFDVSVSTLGIPIAPPNDSHPLAVQIGSTLFLIDNSPTGRYHRIIDPFDFVRIAIAAVIHNLDDPSFEIISNPGLGMVAATVPISPLSTRASAEAEGLLDSALSRLTNLLIKKLSDPPIHASIDYQVPGLVVLTRVGAKNDLLLDGQYELSGYTVRVYRVGMNVRTYIGFSVLTSNHPNNKYYDPTPAQLDRYKRAIVSLRDSSERKICEEFHGEYAQGACAIGVTNDRKTD